MGFTQFNEQQATVALLQRSLERGRLGHAYLLSGGRLEDLEALARTLAKTLNCPSPPRRAANGLALDCCDACLACRKIGTISTPTCSGCGRNPRAASSGWNKCATCCTRCT